VSAEDARRDRRVAGPAPSARVVRGPRWSARRRTVAAAGPGANRAGGPT